MAMAAGADALPAVLADPEVAQALADARDRVDALLRDRRLRGLPAEPVRAVRMLAGRGSAALDGADVDPEDSPMGRVSAACAAVTLECARQRDVLERSPAQAVAALHVVASAWWAGPADDRGRPRAGDDVDDPLHLRTALPAAAARAALLDACALMSSRADLPALAVAAQAHAVVATAMPFRMANGPVARACGRLVLQVRGVDPDGIVPVEAALMQAGRAEYVAALRAHASGDAAPWLRHHAHAVEQAATLAARVLLDG